MRAGTGAAQGVLRHAQALGNRTRGGVAGGGARVPEVFTATELEGFVAGVIMRERESSPIGGQFSTVVCGRSS